MPQPGVEFVSNFAVGRLPMQKQIVLVLIVLGMSLSAIAAGPAPFALSLRLDSRYNRDLMMCTTVHFGEHFNITWTHGNVRSSITGVLREPEGGRYPLLLTVDQHLTDSKTGSSTMQGYK